MRALGILFSVHKLSLPNVIPLFVPDFGEEEFVASLAIWFEHLNKNGMTHDIYVNIRNDNWTEEINSPLHNVLIFFTLSPYIALACDGIFSFYLPSQFGVFFIRSFLHSDSSLTIKRSWRMVDDGYGYKSKRKTWTKFAHKWGPSLFLRAPLPRSTSLTPIGAESARVSSISRRRKKCHTKSQNYLLFCPSSINFNLLVYIYTSHVSSLPSLTIFPYSKNPKKNADMHDTWITRGPYNTRNPKPRNQYPKPEKT